MDTMYPACLQSVVIFLSLGYVNTVDVQSGVRFTLYEKDHTWNEVYALCLDQGGQMVKFETERDLWIFKQVTEQWTTDSHMRNSGRVWIGLHDSEPTAGDFVFRWSDCTYLGDYVKWVAKNDEPNGQGPQHCVSLFLGSGYRTKKCEIQYETVCETTISECWFTQASQKTINGMTPKSEVEVSLDICKQTCLNMSSGSKVCIAVEHMETMCKIFTGSDVYILDSPAMTNNILSDVYVKRCYEGVYEAITPSVPSNSDRTPVVDCSTTTTQTSTTSTIATTQNATAETTKKISSPGETTLMSTAGEETVTTPETASETASPAAGITAETETTVSSSAAAGTTVVSKDALSDVTSPTVVGTASNTSPNGGASNGTSSDGIASNDTSTDGSDATSLPSVVTQTSEETTYGTSGVTSTVTNTTISGGSTLAPGIYYLEHMKDRRCFCLDRDEESIAQLKSLIAALVLDKKNMSSYKRTKSSAKDYRPSANSIGNTGICLIVFIFASIILLDCSRVKKRLVRDVCRRC